MKQINIKTKKLKHNELCTMVLVHSYGAGTQWNWQIVGLLTTELATVHSGTANNGTGT